MQYIAHNQVNLKSGLYRKVEDAIHVNDVSNVGNRIILPPTYTGSPRQMHKLYQDAMCVVAKIGCPDLFITMTCNTKWPEIMNNLIDRQVAADRPDLCARVFQLKLKELMRDLKQGKIFGKCVGMLQVIEFQKRGLPHAHIVIMLASESKVYICRTMLYIMVFWQEHYMNI